MKIWFEHRVQTVKCAKHIDGRVMGLYIGKGYTSEADSQSAAKSYTTSSTLRRKWHVAALLL
jgi:hypothetical protein